MDIVRVTGVFTIAFHFYLPYLCKQLFKLITYSLRSSVLSFLHLFFSKLLESGLSPQIAYIFKVLGAQSCLMVAQQFDQITHEECNNFQDSKFLFIVSDFKIFPIRFLRQLNCGVVSVYQLFYVYYKGKTPLF